MALVRAGRTASLYIDGVANASQTIDTVTDIWNDAPAPAGMSACVGIDGTQPFTGQLDEQMMFTRALTREQIQAVIDHVTG